MTVPWLVVDFEFVSDYVWNAFAIVLYNPDTRRVLKQLEGYCVRPQHQFDEDRIVFWTQHREALTAINNQARRLPSPDTQERRLGAFMDAVRRDFGVFQVVADNTTVDIGFLNGILRSQGRLDLLHIGGQYRIPTCVTTLRKFLGVPAVKAVMAHTPTDDIVGIIGTYHEVCRVATSTPERPRWR